VTSLTPGTVNLILGSDYSGLVPQSPQASAAPGAQPSQATASPAASPSRSSSGVADLAKANGGITAAAACSSDAAAFAGASSP
jgi:hypothetical protein